MFWTTTLAAGLAVAAYVALENTPALHLSHDRETAFWVVVISVLASNLAFASNSPARFLVLLVLREEATTWAHVAFFSLVLVPLVAGYALSRRRVTETTVPEAALTRAPHNDGGTKMSRRASIHFARRAPTSARVKQSDVVELLERLTYSSHLRYWASQLRGSVQERRDKLRVIFDNASADELNHLLQSVSVARLLRFGDMDLFSPDSANAVVYDRLSVSAKAALIQGMMRVQALFQRKQRELVCRVFCSTTKPDDLFALKNRLDGTGDYHSLFKLVYGDMGLDPDLQGRMLAHVQRVGAQAKQRPLKVLCDIDDTLWASGGRWPAGVDGTLPAHAVYPGALCFLEELDRHGMHASAAPTLVGSSSTSEEVPAGAAEPRTFIVKADLLNETGELVESGESTLAELCARVEGEFQVPPWRQKWTVTPSDAQADKRRVAQNLVFLSARPHVYGDLTESASYAQFRAMYEDGRLHTRPTLLPGNLRVGAGVVWRDAMERATAFALDARALAAALALAAYKALAARRGGAAAAGKPPALVQAALDRLEAYANRADAVAGAARPASAASASAASASAASVPSDASNWRPVGRYKAEMFERYCALYPEARFCFVGDDGQGDVLAAETVTEKLGRGAIAGTFVHRVLQAAAGPGAGASQVVSSLDAADDATRERGWAGLGISFFSTYAGAAARALDAGMLEPRAAFRVCLAAREELTELVLQYPAWSWQRHVEELNRDIAAANAAIARAQERAGRPPPKDPSALRVPELDLTS